MNKRILLIEDDQDVSENIHELLELNDYDVSAAYNGQEGIKKALDETFDLILCDITMPKMDGYEVLEILRQHPQTYNVPFLFLTARSDKLDVRVGMNLGADDYITKPYTIKDLLDSIKSRLEKNESVKYHYNEQMEMLRRNISLNLPHELRTPLNVILGFTQLLKMNRDTMPNNEIGIILDAIEDGGKRLLRTVEDFTLLNKLNALENNPTQVQSDETYTEVIITETALAVAAKNSRNSDIIINLQDKRIHLSPSLLDTITAHLVENAIKFSTSGSKITISSELSGDDYCLSFHNTGRGMTKDEIRRIGSFLQFGREEFEQQGSGLGLEIIKKICKVYGGSFSIESQPDEYIDVKLRLKIL